MSKRKRSSEPNLQEKLNKHSDDIFRALKAAKGHERQRLSKRLNEDGIAPDKKERLEREVAVLKSLDLHQTARAHMHSSLLKIKPVAESPDLPEEIRRGLAKPDLSEEERVALHNVTSGLYNREQVKQAVDRAVKTVCQILNIEVPAKAKRSRKGKAGKEEEPKPPKKEIEEDADEEDVRESVEEADDSEWNGFSDDEAAPAEDVESDDEGADERYKSQYGHLLASSSDEEDDFDDERFDRFRGKEKPNLDDISLSGSGSEPELGSEDEDEDEDEPEASASPSPPPAKRKKEKSSASTARPTGSTFLPSLMGGYISGSESASDVDVAPAKKRLGQRQRQAIWEKKFGTSAKHLQKPAKQRGRDSGWDMKRGAVDGDAGQATPWKKGIRNPLNRRGATGANTEPKAEAKKPPTKRDDEGTLHPSWQARKQAKDAEKTATFAGTKVTFD